MSTNTQKLRVLRARTDHDLVVVVSREIDRGLALVEVASFRNSSLFSQAEKACGTAAALLARVSSVSQEDRLRIGARLEELKARLQQVPVYPNARSYPAAFAS